MPPAKGNLAAIKAILGLFLDGPETQGNIRARMRREYTDAHWSRSIVDAGIPALVAQGLIALIASGERPKENVYEITAEGIAEFKRWIRESPRAPMPMREPLQLWIEHSTPDELPVLLAVIKETEEAAFAEVRAAQRRINSDRTMGKLGPPDSSEWNGRLRYAILSDKVLYWQQRAARCKNLRKILQGGHNMHEREPAGDRGDDHV
jgi:DNA-binding PadR family transcriptional regulator